MIKLNGVEINYDTFPDGTTQVWKLKNLDPLDTSIQVVTWDYDGDDEIFLLSQLMDLLDVTFNVTTTIHLIIDHLPYGRQDKKVSNAETFALRTFARIINLLEFDKIFTYDAHSSVASELINNLVDTFPIEEINKSYSESDATCILLPDDGAMKRYGPRLQEEGYTVYCCDKTRDQETGFITEFKVLSDNDFSKERILVVDDICDGGMTFKILAKTIGDYETINLYVSQGIFSKGKQTLHVSGYNKIFDIKGLVSHLDFYKKMPDEKFEDMSHERAKQLGYCWASDDEGPGCTGTNCVNQKGHEGPHEYHDGDDDD